MSNPKDDVLAEIDKRAKKIKDHKLSSSKVKSVKGTILDFLEEVEPIYSIARTAWEFHAMTKLICESLDRKMRVYDSGVQMEVEWNNADDWRELRVTGVRVQWSNWYQKKHNVASEQVIDVTLLLLEDTEE
jgi:hypothetical protein